MFVLTMLMLLILLQPCRVFPQQQDSCNLSWTPPQQISLDTVEVVLTRILRNGPSLLVMWQQYPASGIACSRSTDDGATWSEPQLLIPPTDGNIPAAISAVSQGSWIYLAWTGCEPCSPSPVYHVRFQRSSDFGETWLPIQNLGPTYKGKIAAFASDVFLNFQDSIYQSRFLRSTDNGATFTLLPGSPPLLGTNLFEAFVASPSGLHGLTTRPLAPSGWPETRYFRSTDFGFTWEDSRFLSTLDNAGSRVRDMAASGDTLYVAWIDSKYGGFLTTGTMLLRRSYDGGNTFEPEQILSDNNAFSYRMSARKNLMGIVWDTDEDGSTRYSHVHYAVSNNYGDSFCGPARVETTMFTSEWSDIAVGMKTFVSAGRKDIDSGFTRTVFVTHSDLPTHIDDPAISTSIGFVLGQPYPNPFNSAVTVTYSIPGRASGTIEIFNVLGQRILSQPFERMSSGTYSFTWDGLNAIGQPQPSGVFLLRLVAQNQILHRKIIYLK
jgi:hypothetical protein